MNTRAIAWTIKPFSALTLWELHDLLRLRTDVFVVEQNCPYAELDGRDENAWHVLGEDAGGALVAYARILPPENDGLPHVGRVVVNAAHRRRGLAHQLMRQCLAFLELHYGRVDSALAAQTHLEGFYAAHGYARIGANYMLDGIPHVDMRLNAPA